MLIIKKNAYRRLLNTLGSNLNRHLGYGSPPIFYWYRRMILESQEIENCRYLRRGGYGYRLGHSLGIAHVQCEYVGRKRCLIITDYEINTKVLFSWLNSKQKGGIILKSKPQKPRKAFRKLTTKPLFGYSFVRNDKKEYNLIDSKGNLVTQWFKAIRPFQKSYGKYQIIAYINVDGWFCALGYDGKVYNLNRTWRDACVEENAQILNSDSFKKLITETIDANNKHQTIRLTETQFKEILIECITKIISEIA